MLPFLRSLFFFLSTQIGAFSHHGADGSCELRVRLWAGAVEFACAAGSRPHFLSLYSAVASSLANSGLVKASPTSLPFDNVSAFVPRALPAGFLPAAPAPAAPTAFDAAPLVALLAAGVHVSRRREASCLAASLASTAPSVTLVALAASALPPVLVAAALSATEDVVVRLNAVSALAALAARSDSQVGAAVRTMLSPLAQASSSEPGAVRGCSPKLSAAVSGLLHGRVARLVAPCGAPTVSGLKAGSSGGVGGGVPQLLQCA
jgi:hypothetical protein